MGRWTKGKSGNTRSRPRAGTAIVDLARREVDTHKLIDKLASIAAGANEHSDVDVDQQLRANQLLLNYGYGPPRAEVQTSEGLVIQVVYAETNQIAITNAARGAVTGDSESKRFNVVCCGRRWGKTQLGMDQLIHPALQVSR